MAAEFKIQGLDGVLAKMREVTAQVTLKAVRGSASKAMRIVRDAARANARRIDDPASAADIAKNIAVSTKVYPRLGEVRSRVGVRGGARPDSSRNPDPNNTGHWRYLEIGTSEIAARPFMRPALENNIDRVTNTFVADLNTNIDRVAAKSK
jgi:HK97 gp10 family phage protein